jgi:hypothetical protein
MEVGYPSKKGYISKRPVTLVYCVYALRLHERWGNPKNALVSCYDVDDTRTWKTVCLKCNTSRNLIINCDLIDAEFVLPLD